MIAIYTGAAALLAGTVTVTVARLRTNDNSIQTLLLGMRQLSKPCQEAFDEVNAGPDPTGTRITLAWGELPKFFWNSRLWIEVANHMRLAEPDVPEWAAILNSMRVAHAKTRWLILLSAMELIVGRLGLGMYARVLLWTYGEELELLGLISERCSPLEGTAIQAIL